MDDHKIIEMTTIGIYSVCRKNNLKDITLLVLLEGSTSTRISSGLKQFRIFKSVSTSYETIYYLDIGYHLVVFIQLRTAFMK